VCMSLAHRAICYAQMNLMVSGKSVLGHLEGSSADICIVDICITTDMKEMEDVCIIAELLAKSEYSTKV
jgi:hypothetical protein